MCLPTFLVVGVNKAGTTSLWHYLSQHPQIHMSEVKETNFFVSEVATPSKVAVDQLDDYKELFSDGKEKQERGEISPAYLTFHETAIPNISEVVPDCNIIIVLRNPIERVHSGYYHKVRDGNEHRSFSEAIDDYKDKGFDADGIRHYVDHFGEDQVKILFFDDLKNDLESFLFDIYDFLDVENVLPEDLTIANKSGDVKSPLLRNFLRSGSFFARAVKFPFRIIPDQWRYGIKQQLMQLNMNEKEKMEEPEKAFLTDYYRDEIAELETLTGRDLESWLDI